jgi:uncharacterized protein YjiK
LRLVTALILCALASACSGEQPAPAVPGTELTFQQWSLPDPLREISGLALTDDQRLLAVADEEAIVYEVDYEAGRLVKSFAFGKPVVRGDFEGIALLDDRVWLMTSDGELYSAPEGQNGEQVSFERVKTGIGRECELEGLASMASSGSLALLCKDGRDRKKLRIHVWKPGQGVTEEIRLPEKDMEDAIGKKRVRPSGLEVDLVTGDWVIVAAAQRAVFRISSDGEFRDVIMRLDADRHRQAEGIAITSDGRLLIADEGGRGRARLAVYPAYDKE